MGNLVMPVVDSGLLLQKTIKITAVLALLCMAFFIAAPTITKTYLYVAFREVSKQKMLWETRKWAELKGTHFLVRYQASDKDNAELVLSTAEKNYEPVSSRFGYYPKGKTLIVVYPTRESLGRSFGWAADESAMGVYWTGVIRVLAPSAWVDETDPDKIKGVFESEGPIAHEFTHLMVDYLTGGNYTRWFTEGIAQYEEEKLTGYQVEYRKIRHPGQLYPLSRMDGEFDNLEDQELAYYQSLQAVNYIVDRYGEEGLQKVLKDLGRGYTLEKSFTESWGMSLEQFEKGFQLWAVANN